MRKAEPVIWLKVMSHSVRLTGRALPRAGLWLLVAPAASMVVGLLSPQLSRLGIVGGFLRGFLIAAAVSLVLYTGRRIIEQRRLDFDEVSSGITAFFGDVLNVMFVVWIASLVASVVPGLAYVITLAMLALPIFESVALTTTSGFGAFGQAWNFFQRDFGPWLLGQLPVLLFVGSFWVGGQLVSSLVGGGFVVETVRDVLTTAAYFVAFIYRGVLFLTLDRYAPHARAARFG